MTSVQTAPGLPPSLSTHRSRFLVSASSLRLPPTPPSSTPTPSSTGSDQAYTSRRKRFSPISVTHTTILGREQPTHIVSLGTIDLAAVLRHATSTRTPPELARPRTPEPEEPEPITKDTRERPRYRPPTSPVRPTKPLPSTSRPAPISIVRPRAQFPLYLPILDSRVPPIVLPSLESLDAAAQAQTVLPPAAEGRRSGRARRPASRTLEYTSDPVPPPVRKRRADVSEKQTRTSKRPRKDVNYVIPSLASIEREIAGEDARVRRRRRSETSASLSDKDDSSQEARKA